MFIQSKFMTYFYPKKNDYMNFIVCLILYRKKKLNKKL